MDCHVACDLEVGEIADGYEHLYLAPVMYIAPDVQTGDCRVRARCPYHSVLDLDRHIDLRRVLERTVGKHDFVSDMNRDIFISETAEAARVAAQIEAEESRIDYMGEDADYEEMGMDGDEFY